MLIVQFKIISSIHYVSLYTRSTKSVQFYSERCERRDILEVLVLNSAFQSDSDSDSDDEDLELLLLCTISDKRRRNHLQLADIDEESCVSHFRFEKGHIPRLASALDLPDNYHCNQGTVCQSTEALMILLRRFAYPNRWCELTEFFGRPEPELSMIFNEVKIMDDIYDRFHYLLDDLNLSWLDPELFSRAIYKKGAPLRNCWGFIDGTGRKVCRPTTNQRIMYSGHKRIHCFKFQSVMTPNGLICNLFGPIEGRHHDSYMLAESGLQHQLEQHLNDPNGQPYVLYGDPAYPVSNHILAPFRGAQLTQAENNFNRDMSTVRSGVEWGYGKIVQYFAFMDFSKNLKVWLQPVGKMYIVSALLSNCHTCLYGSLTAQYFNVDPPELEAYLRNN